MHSGLPTISLRHVSPHKYPSQYPTLNLEDSKAPSPPRTPKPSAKPLLLHAAPPEVRQKKVKADPRGKQASGELYTTLHPNPKEGKEDEEDGIGEGQGAAVAAAPAPTLQAIFGAVRAKGDKEGKGAIKGDEMQL